MEPQVTAVRPPIHVQIADDIRVRIEKGEIEPGDSLPTTRELAAAWGCSVGSARAAVALLGTQGLVTGGRGRPSIVRIPPRLVVRDNDRHQAEKDLALQPEDVRRRHGEAEDDLGLQLEDTDPRAAYVRVPAGEELGAVFGVAPGEELLRKTYEKRDKRTGWTRYTYSVSYVPVRLLESKPELLSDSCESWPGGHMHQFRMVGIEIAKVVDEVTARMPTTVEAQRWALEDGVPLVLVRRISIDTTGRVVEVSDAQYPADRTLLRFTTPLALWKD
jgi:GntR family transcriptional regulator